MSETRPPPAWAQGDSGPVSGKAPKANHALNSGDWTRGLVNANRAKRITAPACNLGLRLAVAINWAPTHGGPPGLYWSVEAALEHVGVSLSTWKRYREELVQAGFLRKRKGNYVVMMNTEFHRSLTGEQL